MVHSAEFNAKRRAAYAEGRLLGLSPRDAGHLYGPKFVEKAQAQIATAKRERKEAPASERQELFRSRLEARLGREVTLRESRERYQMHNYSKVYTKATITLVDNDTGLRHKSRITLTSDRPLTRAEARRQVELYVDKNSANYGSADLLAAVSFDERIEYEEVAF